MEGGKRAIQSKEKVFPGPRDSKTSPAVALDGAFSQKSLPHTFRFQFRPHGVRWKGSRRGCPPRPRTAPLARDAQRAFA